MLEPVHTGLQEQIVKISGIFQASGQVGNLKLATVGLLTPQKLAITINQGFFFFFYRKQVVFQNVNGWRACFSL